MPDKIGKYVVVREVGRGSTGIVYLSHDAYYGRDVAIKVYNMDTGGDEERARIARKMFLSEAHLVACCKHPHILPIYDAGEENGHCYIVTEHVHGARTLAAYCRPDNLLRIDDTVEIMFKCAKALHYAHSRGVIHRDIKPSNIMLTQDSDVRIIDFGIALVSDSDISRIEGIAGSPRTCPGAGARVLELTNRSDLYSLGAVMYEFAHRRAAVPRRQSAETAAPDRVRDGAADPHAAQGHTGGARDGGGAGAAEGSGKRCKSGLDFAADLTRVHQRLREANARIDRQEQFGVLRRLKFFHEFSHAEIWEVLRASSWQDYATGEEIVKEGELDDRFYILVSGNCVVERHSQRVGALDTGDCFGEASYVPRQAYRHHPRGSGGDGAEGELDAAGAGIGVLPAAIQPGVPERADRAPAKRRTRPPARRLNPKRLLRGGGTGLYSVG